MAESPRGAALVTGAGKRIGRALALAAGRAGYDVAVHYRTSGTEAEAVAAEIRAMGVQAATVYADLSDAPACTGLIGRAALEVGPLTLLVNSASLLVDDRAETVTGDGFDALMGTNLRAPLLMARAFAASLPADRTGLIVNLTDQRVWRLNPQLFSYTLTKAALWTATQTLAQAFAPRIRVNAIGPGPTFGSVLQAAGEFEAEAAAIPLGRAVGPEEIAAALTYLIDAPSVTGQMIAVDGGQHLAWKTPDVINP
ncbi:MAG: SDR family oxidoreductase [Caulobacteraceae bacterium]